MPSRYLQGRCAIVTGGASGQGRATALALAARGANVAIGSFIAGKEERPPGDTYYPTDEELNAVVGEIRSNGVQGLGQHHNARSNL